MRDCSGQWGGSPVKAVSGLFLGKSYKAAAPSSGVPRSHSLWKALLLGASGSTSVIPATLTRPPTAPDTPTGRSRLDLPPPPPYSPLGALSPATPTHDAVFNVFDALRNC